MKKIITHVAVISLLGSELHASNKKDKVHKEADKIATESAKNEDHKVGEKKLSVALLGLEEDDEDLITFYGAPEYVSFYVDYGFDRFLKNKSRDLPHSFFGSRYVDFTLCYNMVPRNTRVAIAVGIGYSNNTFSFKEKNKTYNTLIRDSDKSKTDIVDGKDYVPTKERDDYRVNGSYLNLHHISFLMELKFFKDKFFPKDSFVFAVGLRAYILWKANVALEYIQDFSKKKVVIHDDMTLKKLKFSFHTRFSWRRVGLIYELGVSNLFSTKDNKLQGPKLGYIQKVGIFVDLF